MFRAGLSGDPVRPILRMERAGGARDHALLPGPVCGRGIWTGRLPADCTGLLLSPASAAGPFSFSFSVDRLTALGRPALLLGALRRDPAKALGALRERLLGRRVRARHALSAIWATIPFGDYATWRRERDADPLPDPEPSPAPGAGPAPPLGFLVDAGGADAEALARTVRSLAAQSSRAWRAWIVRDGSPGSTPPLPPAALAAAQPGLSPLPLPRPEAEATAAATCGWVGRLRAGDLLAPNAVATLAAATRREPLPALVYADEDAVDSGGRRSDPFLKPGWSPRLAAGRSYLGLALVRSSLLASADPDRPADALALRLPPASIRHVRRILLHRPAAAVALAVPAGQPPGVPATLPSVSVVIPTRDRLSLLEPCLDGLLRRTDYPRLEVILVDNGSRDEETRAFYRRLAADGRVRILDRPGPFNYSALTNDGAAAATGDLLLLLNNDVEPVEAGWLRALVREAGPPDVGAVGAKLLYPNGRIQHAGVVLGLGGAAGHLYRNRADAGPGWAGGLRVPHEVSAVTGACLLVARDRFHAVGGLDAADLPVSFNDIDLCLKLRARGWRNILVPEAVLTHHESASRGRDDRGEKQARAEREARVFAERWLFALRDDPYFHPGLSLLRFEPALG